MRADKKQLCRGETALNSCMYKGSYVEEKLPCRDAAADSKQLCRTRREKALQRKNSFAEESSVEVQHRRGEMTVEMGVL